MGMHGIEVVWNVFVKKPHEIVAKRKAGFLWDTLELTLDGNTIMSRPAEPFFTGIGSYQFSVDGYLLEMRWKWGINGDPQSIVLVFGNKVIGQYGDNSAANPNAIFEIAKGNLIPIITKDNMNNSATTLPTSGKESQIRPEPEKISGIHDVAHSGLIFQIFISYRRSDSQDIAGRIYDRLTGKFGRDPVFKDVDSIPLGLDFREYLDQKVGECDVLLAIIGDRWLEASDDAGERRLKDPADFVRIEIESALKRRIPVIPLLVRGARMPRETELPGSLKKLAYRNGTPIRSAPDFHRDMDRLISALEKHVSSEL